MNLIMQGILIGDKPNIWQDLKGHINRYSKNNKQVNRYFGYCVSNKGREKI